VDEPGTVGARPFRRLIFDSDVSVRELRDRAMPELPLIIEFYNQWNYYGATVAMPPGREQKKIRFTSIFDRVKRVQFST